MKKVLIFLMAVSLFVSCNNDKNGKGKYDRDRNSSDNRDRDDYRNDDRNTDKNNDRDNNDDENTDNKDKNDNQDKNDNSGSWSKSDENKFMDDCEGTAKENVGAARANEYCDCMLQKIKKMYSSYTEADRELAGSSQADINKMAADCNGQ